MNAFNHGVKCLQVIFFLINKQNSGNVVTEIEI